MLKHFIFKWHGIISIATVAVVSLFAFCSKQQSPLELIGPTLAGALGFSYFSQQQKLAEIQLFKTLFTEFNSRYNDLNEKLQSLRLSNEPIDAETEKVIDYFNLCAEEYLFYRQGYILNDAWRSWCNGMLWYLEDDRFRTLWDREVKQGSYYGLSIDLIKQGAGR